MEAAKDPVDRAAMIEEKSRSLMQEIARDRMRTQAQGVGSADNAQRRIRSAENQHRSVQGGKTIAREGPREALAVASPLSSSAIEDYNADVDLEEEQQVGERYVPPNLEDTPPHLDFHQELKRPLSRKKNPSASAAAGLGAFAGPTPLSNAFEQRKARQPIPVESWGPRPPSRAGRDKTEPGKTAGFDPVLGVSCLGADPILLRGAPQPQRGRAETVPSSSVGRAVKKPGDDHAFGAKVVGGTWAAARAEPRVNSETRRGRERKTQNRGTPEMSYAAADLGVVGCRAPNQQLSKSFSGAFDHDRAQFQDAKAAPRQVASRTGTSSSSWAYPVDGGGSLEVSGCGYDAVAAPWPESPASQSCGSPPTRKGRHSFAEQAAVSEEVVVEAEDDLALHGSYRRDVTPPAVIVTRSSQRGQNRGEVRRGSDQRGARDRAQPPFTTLPEDFLSLFAS